MTFSSLLTYCTTTAHTFTEAQFVVALIIKLNLFFDNIFAHFIGDAFPYTLNESGTVFFVPQPQNRETFSCVTPPYHRIGWKRSHSFIAIFGKKYNIIVIQLLCIRLLNTQPCGKSCSAKNTMNNTVGNSTGNSVDFMCCASHVGSMKSPSASSLRLHVVEIVRAYRCYLSDTLSRYPGIGCPWGSALGKIGVLTSEIYIYISECF